MVLFSEFIELELYLTRTHSFIEIDNMCPRPKQVHEQEIEISQLNRSVLALEQTKTTLQLKYSDLIQVQCHNYPFNRKSDIDIDRLCIGVD